MRKGNRLRQEQAASTNDVRGAIRDWLADVNAVNSFVDKAPNVSSSQASQALQFAQREPGDLMVLSRICGVSGRYTAAVADLNNVFGGVLTNLQSIVNNPKTAPTAVANINKIRCCNVLPDLDVLWREAAQRYRIQGQVQTTVPRPRACASAKC
ncbi:uncharacterized protein PG986_002448 [Apiospora aurea]|uniref:Uncharacterized protein n=1 Tax=Apiospora aurea TaxID=335848 RepID=A0ABR1QNV2_9PEZI